MRRLAQTALLLLCIIVAASCQQSVSDDITEGNTSAAKSNVNISISQIEQIPFSTPSNIVRATDVKQACSRILFIVYNDDGTRKESKVQNSTDADFGKFSTNLDNGTYRFVILAYNSKENPSSYAKPTEITFGNNGKMSDTFLWSEEITVDGKVEKSVTLKRAVAMFRLVTTDNVPSQVTRINFHYTGGSSSIDATTGIGCKNSKQDENITVTETGKPGTFEVYTFPRDDENVLDMTITAFDAKGNVVVSKHFDDVPITRNKVTQYTGNFFNNGGSGTGNITFEVSIEDAWGGTIEQDF